MKIRSIVIGLLALSLSASVSAAKKEVVLNPTHPDRYVVAPGDTVWDVAAKFLKNPWQWPDLWGGQARSGRALRAGDVLTLTQVDGKPHLQLNQGLDGKARVIKLTPSVRVAPLTDTIPTIPLNAVRGYLSSPRVLSETELDAAPYIVGVRDTHRSAATGEKIYVRGLGDNPDTHYSVFRKGNAYVEGETGTELGYEAIPVGDAMLVKEGDPTTLVLTHNEREAMPGDRLLPMEEERLPNRYEPHMPEFALLGHVVGVLGGIPNHLPRVGRYSVVVIDKGANDGLEEGHVLLTLQRGKEVIDHDTDDFDKNVKLPDEVVGKLLIFRPFEKVSYGLVMETEGELTIGDLVQSP